MRRHRLSEWYAGTAFDCRQLFSLDNFLPEVGTAVFALQNDFEAIQEFLQEA
jgi:hypothetical protein